MRFFTINRTNAELAKTRRLALIVANAAITDTKMLRDEMGLTGKQPQISSEEYAKRIKEIDSLEMEIRSKKIEKWDNFKTRLRKITEMALSIESIGLGITLSMLGNPPLAGTAIAVGIGFALVRIVEAIHLRNKFSRAIYEVKGLQQKIIRLDPAITEHRISQLFSSFNYRAGASKKNGGSLSDNTPIPQ